MASAKQTDGDGRELNRGVPPGWSYEATVVKTPCQTPPAAEEALEEVADAITEEVTDQNECTAFNFFWNYSTFACRSSPDPGMCGGIATGLHISVQDVTQVSACFQVVLAEKVRPSRTSVINMGAIMTPSIVFAQGATPVGGRLS